MKIVDLHVHSTFSDGTLTPTELVSLAKKQDLSAFALTDHDTVKGIPQVLKAAKEMNIEVIPGIEISTHYLDKEIHIVGLCVDHTSEHFNKEIQKEIQRRTDRNKEIIHRINDMGIKITLDELQAMHPDSAIARPHFANLLVRNHIAKDIPDAFERFLSAGRPLYVPRKRNTPKEAISLIRNAGGVPILAHPLLYHLSFGELRSLCMEFKEYGLAGIETLYSW